MRTALLVVLLDTYSNVVNNGERLSNGLGERVVKRCLVICKDDILTFGFLFFIRSPSKVKSSLLSDGNLL